MSIMTSGNKANHDPAPYVRTYNGAEPKRITPEIAALARNRFINNFGEIVWTQYVPRPEFDVPVNPILAKFRTMVVRGTPQSRAEDWLFYGHWRNVGYEGATTEQIDHASRVLTRLANLAKVSS